MLPPFRSLRPVARSTSTSRCFSASGCCCPAPHLVRVVEGSVCRLVRDCGGGGGAGAGLPHNFSFTDLHALEDAGMGLGPDIDLPAPFGLGDLDTGTTGLGRGTGFPGGSQARANTPPGSPGTLIAPATRGQNDSEDGGALLPQTVSTLPQSPS